MSIVIDGEFQNMPTSAPGWDAIEYPTRSPAWHMRCCEAFSVSVQRESEYWWRATAHTREGFVLFVTGGRTRRHAETNALNGAEAPMSGSDDSLFSSIFDTEPS